MPSHYDHLMRTTATDGASAMLGTSQRTPSTDVDDLLDAWFQERQVRVETTFFLDQARQILGQILSEDVVSPASRRKAKRLLLAIKASKGNR
jgi:hypothetical protein